MNFQVKLKTVLMSFSILLIGMVVVTLLFLSRHNHRELAITKARQEAELLLAHNLAIHDYFTTQLKPAVHALGRDALGPDYFAPAWMSSTYAIRQILKKQEQFQPDTQETYYYKECAINARSPENEADAFERDFLQRLNQNPELQESSTVRSIDGIPHLVVMRRGETLQAECLTCHGTPEQAPRGMVDAYGAKRSFHRRVGETVSALSIRIPMATIYHETNLFTWQLAGLLALLSGATLALIRLIYSRLVTTPAGRILSQATRIANDNRLEETLPRVHVKEFSELGVAFNRLVARLREKHNTLETQVEQRTRDLQQAYDNLAASETRYRQLNQAMQQPVILCEIRNDQDGAVSDLRLLHANPAFETLLARSTESMIGRSLGEIMPESGSELIARYRRAGQEKTRQQFEFYSRPLGRSFDIVFFSPQPGQVAAIVNDITKRRQTEQARDKALAFIETLLERLPVGIRVFDGESGQCLRVNQTAAKLLGGDVAAVRNANFRAIESWQENGLDVLAEEALWTGEVRQAEVELTTTFGKHVWASYTFSRFNMEGKSHLLVLCIDISERQQLLARLRQAEKMETVGTLAGGIAHDFNNILSAIIGYAEIAKLNIDRQSPIAADIDEIIKAGQRAAALVKQILTYTRQEPTPLKPMAPAPVIEDGLKLLRSTLPATLEIRSSIATDCPTILGDPIKLEQVLLNLCTNAAKAITKETGLLQVSLANVRLTKQDLANNPNLQPGAYVELTVRDTGYGMDAFTLSRMFEPYFTTRQSGDGSGLGLAVVHGIVEESGGLIRVDSQLGAGTTIRVALPAQNQPPAILEATEDTAETSEKSSSQKHILVVDDETALQYILQTGLERAGYRVTCMGNPQEALDALHASPRDIDLLITDQAMPEMTGARLAKQALALDPDLPIILYTGYSETIDEKAAKQIGIRDFFIKPVELAALTDAIRTLFAQQDR